MSDSESSSSAIYCKRDGKMWRKMLISISAMTIASYNAVARFLRAVDVAEMQHVEVGKGSHHDASVNRNPDGTHQ